MEAEIVAITCMIVLGVILTLACSYLCTQGYNFLLKFGQQRHLGRSSSTRPCVRSSIRRNRNPDSIRSIANTANNTVAVTETAAPCIVTQNSTTTIVRGDIISERPPPLPPRPRTHTPWTTTSSGRDSQLITFTNRRRSESEDFQFPPTSVVSALPFRNTANGMITRDPRDILEILRAFEEPQASFAGNRMSMVPTHEPNILVSQAQYYRQSVPAALGGSFNLQPGSGGWTRMMNTNRIPSTDLPPTYDEAMRHKQLEGLSNIN